MSIGTAQNGRDSGYTLKQAVDDVFGTWPFAPWSQLVVIVAGGFLGALASSWLQPERGLQAAEFRWAACAGYGLVVAALVTQLPRAVRLCQLWSGSRRRAVGDEQASGPWWPLRLLAAALRGLPLQQIGQANFALAVDRTARQARDLLTQRMWPSCVAAFTAPVLGLLSAWESGSQAVREATPAAAPEAGDVYMRFLLQVSPPMVATISAGLGLMVLLAVLDQLTKGLLQRWATDVALADKDDTFVTSNCGDAGGDGGGGYGTGTPSEPPPPMTPPGPQINADDLERLKDLFPSRS